MNLYCVILAAGKGKRMMSSKPKPLQVLAGYPLISHLILKSQKLAATSCNIILPKKHKDFDPFIPNDCNVIVQEEPTGTADAVKLALSSLPSTGVLLILYADSPLLRVSSLKSMIRKVKLGSKLVLSAIDDNGQNQSYGRIQLQNNTPKKILEIVDEGREDNMLANGGLMCIDLSCAKELINSIKRHPVSREYFLTSAVEIAYKKKLKTNYVIFDQSEIIGLDTPNQLTAGEKVWQARKRIELINKKGTKMQAPDTVYFSLDTKVGFDCRIDPSVYFGAGVVLNRHVHIKSFSYVEGVDVKSNVVIGPFARVRGQTNIASNARVGNFVEVKNSTIGKNVKINHLSYIGDSEIYQNVNIGAGVVTCNFDGKNKNKTIIEKNCFIGSNASIIAPIRLSKNSYVAAGSVVYKNLDSYDLGINRGEQKNITNWYRRRNGK